MTYRVSVSQTIYGEVIVEADNEAEARELAREEYDYDNISWDDDSSFEILEVEED